MQRDMLESVRRQTLPELRLSAQRSPRITQIEQRHPNVLFITEVLSIYCPVHVSVISELSSDHYYQSQST